MQISYKLTKLDYLIYQLYIYETNPKERKKRFFWRSLSVGIWLFAIFYISYTSSPTNGFILFLVFILMLCFYPFYVKSSVKKQFKKYIQKYFINSINKEITASYKDNEICVSIQKNNSFNKFSAKDIKKIVKFGDMFYIFVGENTAIIVPNDSPNNLAFTTHIAKALNLGISIENNDKLIRKYL
ncbi:YcxB family protein [Campylobacter geochelonis]|uniref:YcxB-like C-terminal domain-containing protein n=1 Tax=Campylobacter geochelonis TaxID=1780362 RepID=A0A128EQF2_9BACT|nr:YcxB family protein [Campylobacter geochelonis]QKF71512.1 hypothetical protein CGEO_1214 [Campylobacter geochelonis]CZE48460.1 Uncharacterised protein [Campylobacter geochelonis]CZE50804.1 Uncharacterised protein [Campylobacter geochelonis]